MLRIEDCPEVPYSAVGGCIQQLDKLRDLLETPFLYPEKFAKLGIEPVKGAVLWGPRGSAQVLCARAIAHNTGASIIRVSQLGDCRGVEGAKVVRKAFETARTKPSALVVFEEMHKAEDGALIELVSQLDNLHANEENTRVLVCTDELDSLEPSLMRLGRLERKVEFCLPDLQARTHILQIHTLHMHCAARLELVARLCHGATGAEVSNLCFEAEGVAKRGDRRRVEEKDFRCAIDRVIQANQLKIKADDSSESYGQLSLRRTASAGRAAQRSLGQRSLLGERKSRGGGL